MDQRNLEDSSQSEDSYNLTEVANSLPEYQYSRVARIVAEKQLDLVEDYLDYPGGPFVPFDLLNEKTSRDVKRYIASLTSEHDVSATRAQAKSKETKILQEIKKLVLTNGAITVLEYMKEVNNNHMSGYHIQRNRIKNSPAISQLFGDVIAEWCLNEWIKAGKPKPWYIVEIGPNRGDLADELLRVFTQNDAAKEVVSLHLVEVSPHLSQFQEEKLCETFNVPFHRRHFHLHTNQDNGELAYKQNITKHGVPVSWYRSLEDVPEGFSCIIAYELFDAFPIHKLQKTNEGWREVLIDLDDGPGEHHLRYVLSPSSTTASQFFIDQDEGRSSLEVSPESGVLVQEIAAKIERGGFSLLIDCGHDGTKTDTFRAYKCHALHKPLSEPGTADLIADIDFSYLKKIVQGKALTFGPVTQKEFLDRMGIKTKYKKIFASTHPNMHPELISTYHMLVSSGQMGEKLKFLSLFPADMADILKKSPSQGFHGN